MNASRSCSILTAAKSGIQRSYHERSAFMFDLTSGDTAAFYRSYHERFVFMVDFYCR
jgi:hypothetical protein